MGTMETLDRSAGNKRDPVEDLLSVGGMQVSVLVDPRIERCKRHELSDMLSMALCAVLCGAEGWIAVEQWALGNEEWLRSFLKLPNGIPSHDTFDRVFARLCPKQFSELLLSWTDKVRKAVQVKGGVIAIDGKTLRGSKDSQQHPIHLLSAWASDACVVLAQRAVDGKTNEITEIPALLELLDISGCIVTLDAMGCQKAIAQQIRAKKAHYVLSLKANQKGLHTYAKQRIKCVKERGFRTVKGEHVKHDVHRTCDAEHGRIETREVTVLSKGERFDELYPGWASAQSLAQVCSMMEHKNKVTEQTRYFITSLPATDAASVAAAIRAHWSVENGLHWSLDVQMNEDASRLRKGHGPENFATLRRTAISLLRQDKSIKVGAKTKALRAAVDRDYLLKVLQI